MSSETLVLNVEAKTEAGKGAARDTRNSGRVPGVVYGGGKDPVMVSFVPGDLERTLRNPAYYSTQYDLTFPDGTKEHVLPKAVQFDKVLDHPIHLDFLRVTGATKVTVSVPVEFANEETCPGLKKGGVLSVNRHEIDVVGRMDAIPEKLVIDLADVDVNSVVKWSDVDAPKGIRPVINDRDFAVANIGSPTVGGADDADEGEAAAE